MPHYIHFMPINSPIFNSELIRLINDTMDSKEHLFLIGNKQTYEQLSQQYKNIIYEPFGHRLSTIRKYDSGHEIFILHGMVLSEKRLYHLKKRLAKRMVWCVWGHDLYKERKQTLFGQFKEWVRNHKIAQFRSIVIGFKYDIHEIRHRFGEKVPVFNALYVSGYFQEEIDYIVKNHQRTDERINIMVGHSAYPFLQHKKILNQLAFYKEENIIITLIVSYGDSVYAKEIIEYATGIFGVNKLNVIRDFMTWDRYIKMLCNIDIAIFDFDHQAAFGNLILLSYLGKKLYLSPSGIMYKAFQAEHVEVYDCSKIGQITFEELKTLPQSENNISYSKSLLNKENIINQWKQLFQAVR